MGFLGDLSNPFKDVDVCKTWAYGIGGDVVATGVGVIQDAPEGGRRFSGPSYPWRCYNPLRWNSNGDGSVRMLNRNRRHSQWAG